MANNLNLNIGDTVVVLAGRQHIISNDREDYLSLEDSITTTYNNGKIAFGTVPSETPSIGDGVDHPRIPPKQI
jgi:hypothetical protein